MQHFLIDTHVARIVLWSLYLNRVVGDRCVGPVMANRCNAQDSISETLLRAVLAPVEAIQLRQSRFDGCQRRGAGGGKIPGPAGLSALIRHRCCGEGQSLVHRILDAELLRAPQFGSAGVHGVAFLALASVLGSVLGDVYE